MINHKIFKSSKNNVWKYVFKFKNAIAESVLYKYKKFEDRTVICCSVQSGCPVGCSFCGTGNNFLRNLTDIEISYQINFIIKKIEKEENIHSLNARCKKLQIMFMSMGEPMLNFAKVKKALKNLNELYPNADLLLSTIGIKNSFVLEEIVKISKKIDKIGLQFSIHESTDKKRNILIPFKNKLSLSEIRDFGITWWKETGRKPYLNYCINSDNDTGKDFFRLTNLFSPIVFNFTFSVICNPDKSKKKVCNLNKIKNFSVLFKENGYDARIFNPDGQDDIGGGCGQLWYVQDYIKNIKNTNKKRG